MLKHFLLRAFGWLGLKSPLLTLSWLTKHDTIIRNIARDKNRCCQNQVIFIQRNMLLIYKVILNFPRYPEPQKTHELGSHSKCFVEVKVSMS